MKASQIAGSMVRPALIGLLLATGALIAWGASTAFGALWQFNSAIAASNLSIGRMPMSTKLYDREGHLLNEVFNETRRSYIQIDQVSPFLRQATVGTEDASFYENWGVSPRGIARALWNNLTNPEAIQGGSTITQQLIKNTIIPEEERYARTPERKVHEAMLALLLTRRYSKDQILEWYLNQVFYGNNSYGIESAAQSYFGKAALDLTLAEAAMLAGLPAAPAFYDPYTRPSQAKARQEDVLGLMARHGYITLEQANTAATEPLPFKPLRFGIEAPHFVMYVREMLEARYGPDALYRGGLQVTTSLDLDLQREAERIVQEQLGSPASKRRRAGNAALTALRPQTGEVLVMVGSADFENDAIDGQVNVALAERQPGSAIKPITYAAAFMKGWSPATVLEDKPTSFPDAPGRLWTPKSVDGVYRGWVTARQALAMSLNTPAVLALHYAGLPAMLDLAHRMGITSLLRMQDYGLSLTLGGGEVRLLDLTYAYSVFAGNGMQHGQPRSSAQRQPGMRELDPVVILKVEAPNGSVLEEFVQPEQRQVLPAPYAYLITDILSDNATRSVFFGSNSPLQLGNRPAAAKTGTTDDNRDNWTVGYTPDLVTGVWVGNTDNTQMAADAFGSSTAAPIWNAFMTFALKDTPPKPFPMPAGLVRTQVCASTGQPPGRRSCPDLRGELFVQGKSPAADPASQRQRGDDEKKLVEDLQQRLADIVRLRTEGKFVEAKQTAADLLKRLQEAGQKDAIDPRLEEQLIARLNQIASETPSPIPTTPPAQPSATPRPPGQQSPGPATATPRPAATTPPPNTSATPAQTATEAATPTPVVTGSPQSSPTPSVTNTPQASPSPGSTPPTATPTPTPTDRR